MRLSLMHSDDQAEVWDQLEVVEVSIMDPL